MGLMLSYKNKDYTQDDVNKAYSNWRNEDFSRTAEDAYNFGIGQFGDSTNTQSMLNNASAGFKYDQNALNKAYADTMKTGGVTGATDPRFAEHNTVLRGQAQLKGVGDDQYKIAQDQWLNSLNATATGAVPTTTTNATGATTTTTTPTTTTPTPEKNSDIPPAPAVTAAPVERAQAAPPQTVSYTAEQTQVDPTRTTQGLMNSLLAEDSPYLQRARALAMERMNERGLSSSSMAQGAGVAAAIDAALGIAAPDAQIYSNTARENTGFRNAANQFGASATNAANLQGAQQAHDVWKTRTAADQTQWDTTNRIASDQWTTQAKIAAEAKSRQDAQTFDKEMAGIKHGYELDTLGTTHKYNMEGKSQDQIDRLHAMAAAHGYDLENMSTAQQIELNRMEKTQSYLKDTLKIQQDFEISKMDHGAALALSQMSAAQINTLATLAAQHGYEMEKLTSNQVHEMERLMKQGEISTAVAGIGAAASTSNAMTAAETQKALAAMNIDATRALRISDQEFMTITRDNDFARNTITTLQKTLADIDMNPNFTDVAAKTTAKNNAVNAATTPLLLLKNTAKDATLTAAIDSILED